MVTLDVPMSWAACSNVGGANGQGANCLLKMDSEGYITLDGDTTITIKVGSSKITIDGKSITMKATTVNVKGTSQTVVGPSVGKRVTITGKGAVDIIGYPVNINQKKRSCQY